ncbi:MAG: adenylate/guanylate cyclase domain-containing protein [Verrucomicrobiota bacterium]
MPAKSLHRHYSIPYLDFTDFWDICGYFLRVQPQFKKIRYSIFTAEAPIIEDEQDISLILKVLHDKAQSVARFHATLYDGGDDFGPVAKVDYVTEAGDTAATPMGLTVQTPEITRMNTFEFEEVLFEKYNLDEDLEPRIEFGIPCEVLAAIIDLRGFSAFCEQPQIESPYTCGLMYAFYQSVEQRFHKYRPDLIKYLGDGVLVLWETTYEDRAAALNVCLNGMRELQDKWNSVRRSPQFSHGAPEQVAVGISFGLASQIPGADDYIGRPLNVASRLCSVCGGSDILIDKSVPGLDDTIPKDDISVHIKSFGRYHVWRVRTR